MVELRVLHVLDGAARVSGVATHVRGLIAEQRALGYDVRVMALMNSVATQLPDFAQERFPSTFSHVQGWRARAALQRQLTRTNPALIHLHSGFTTISPVLVRAFAAFAPTIGTLHDVRPFCFRADRLKQPQVTECSEVCGYRCIANGCYAPRTPLDLIKRIRTLATCSAALTAWRELAGIVVPSRYMEKLALKHGFSAALLTRIPNFTNLGPPRLPGSRPVKPSIVYMGRLTAEKGVSVLIDALKRIERYDWNAILVGEGPLSTALADKTSQYGLRGRVTIVSDVDPNERSAILARSYMLVLPSLIPESFGLSGLEASAHGLPVVSFGLGGVTEWLREGRTGLIARPAEAEALATQMIRLLEAPEFASRLGIAGQQLIRRQFTAAGAVKRLSQLYETCMATQ